MICNKSLPFICVSKKGIALSTLLISVVLMDVFAVILAVYLDRQKPNPIVPVTTVIAADYQMESAIIMQMQKYKNSGAEPKSFEKEILPGINMSVLCSKIEEGQWLFHASLKGRGIEKSIKVKGYRDIPDKLVFLE